MNATKYTYPDTAKFMMYAIALTFLVDMPYYYNHTHTYMIAFLHRQLIRISHPFRGLRYVMLHDKAVRLDLLIGVFIVILGYIVWPLTLAEFAFLAFGYALLLITELQNTAHEEALDRIHPDKDEVIGRSKDIAAASVLVAACLLGAVILVIIFMRLAERGIL
jgi:diacylglycerol kinase